MDTLNLQNCLDRERGSEKTTERKQPREFSTNWLLIQNGVCLHASQLRSAESIHNARHRVGTYITSAQPFASLNFRIRSLPSSTDFALILYQRRRASLSPLSPAARTADPRARFARISTHLPSKLEPHSLVASAPFDAVHLLPVYTCWNLLLRSHIPRLLVGVVLVCVMRSSHRRMLPAHRQEQTAPL